MKRYNPKEIEPKWQQAWTDSKLYEASDSTDKPKRYVLEYFPYPSGAAMHVGHVRNYTIGDAIARFARMQGYNVLHPMGWDAFGLPAENYAIKTGISPQQAIEQNTAKFKRQLTQMGFSYDWSREFASSDPEYYRWTQWFFLLLFKRGLAYQKESLQWWCPVDKTVLANEQVEAGLCWRCGNEVEKKALKQWFFKITDYADRLAADLDSLDWSDALKNMQRNWIGRSQGAVISFAFENSEKTLQIFTTRPETIFGATFMVVAPEHPILKEITADSRKEAVEAYVKQAQAKSDVERQETTREKTGEFTGAYVLNPINQERIPVWVSDYVLYGYGTGAIMAVPAHDERDWHFAGHFDLPILRVVKNDEPDGHCTSGEGVMQHSGIYNGLPTSEARERIVSDLEKQGAGKERINYKIRDWLISRQRYWGAPIPIIHCPKDGPVAVPDDQLPVVLPDMKSFEPSGDGRSPLARVPEFMNTTCPTCGGPAERETDTMDGFACSSWYMWRFIDPHNTQHAFDPDKLAYWAPVDDYIGGAEHAVMHLLYVRMWTKVMYDAGILDFDEPIKSLRNHGMILAPDGQKMSKSKGNTIEPDGLIEQGYGADAIRIMELFIGPWNQAANWSVEGLGGAFRFLQRIWALTQEYLERGENDAAADDFALQVATHQTIHRVTKDMKEMGYNTAIAGLMEYVNELYKLKTTIRFEQAPDRWASAITALLQLLAPFAPHIAEELWQQLGNKDSIHVSSWPIHDPWILDSKTMLIIVQVNGKVRAKLEIASDASEEAILAAAKADVRVANHLAGSEPKKSIYVPNKLVSFVV